MSEKTKNILAALLIAAGAVVMLLGALRGETAEILKKATMVCLECIGIG